MTAQHPEPATEFVTQRSHSARTAVHLRMKSQGLRELFFGVAVGAAPRLRVRSGGTVIAQRPEAECIWSVRPFLLRRGVSWRRGSVGGGVAPGASGVR